MDRRFGFHLLRRVCDGSSPSQPLLLPSHPFRQSKRQALLVDRQELAAALVEHGYLEGDFVLRSGRRSSYYLDKFRFETQPDVLRALGEELASVAQELEPEAVRLACPVLGAVVLASAASLDSGLPFVIV